MKLIGLSNMEHCCQNMDAYATEANCLVKYDPSDRSYHFILNDDPHGTHQVMWFCPWCGSKLPEELGEEWGRILKADFGIEEPFREWDRVPPEFKTDEWWKKRGL
jgi:hypothetical protein